MIKHLYVAATALTIAAGSASALPIVNGGFDDPSAGFLNNGNGGQATGTVTPGSIPGSGWAVFDEILGWKAVEGTAGIEIQRGTITSPDSPNNYVELDSNGNGGTTNSGMYQDVALDTGIYYLKFSYRARVGSEAGTNGVGYSVATSGTDVMGASWDVSGTAATINPSPAGGNIATSDNTQWIDVFKAFEVTQQGNVRLSFWATGNDESLGGFIDSVGIFAGIVPTSSQIPLPAGMWLMGTALAGFGFASRRRRKAS